MRINSIEVEDLNEFTGRVQGISKSSWKKGVNKPTVGPNDQVFELPVVTASIEEKIAMIELGVYKRADFIVTVRTTSGVFRKFVKGRGI